MADTSLLADKNQRLNLGVGLFLTVYGAYHLLNDYAGDNFEGSGFLLMGLGLLVAFASGAVAAQGPSKALNGIALVMLVIGGVIAVIDMAQLLL